jgi:hypothetical protein
LLRSNKKKLLEMTEKLLSKPHLDLAAAEVAAVMTVKAPFATSLFLNFLS